MGLVVMYAVNVLLDGILHTCALCKVLQQSHPLTERTAARRPQHKE